MARIKAQIAEAEAMKMCAALMAASARTAPKTRGIDDIETVLLDGPDLEDLAQAMERKAETKPDYLAPSIKRDAQNVRKSGAVLLIGCKGNPKGINRPLDCGACGYPNCQTLENVTKKSRDFGGPICIFQAIDLGIALGSAVAMAREMNVDNRMMYTMGIAARDMAALDSEVIIGIPLSVSGKSPYFDR